MRPKPVEVTWYDSSSDGGWASADETLSRARALPCTSVGYLLKHDEAQVVIAQSHSPEEPRRSELWADSLTIPAAVVTEVRSLRK